MRKARSMPWSLGAHFVDPEDRFRSDRSKKQCDVASFSETEIRNAAHVAPFAIRLAMVVLVPGACKKANIALSAHKRTNRAMETSECAGRHEASEAECSTVPGVAVGQFQ